MSSLAPDCRITADPVTISIRRILSANPVASKRKCRPNCICRMSDAMEVICPAFASSTSLLGEFRLV